MQQPLPNPVLLKVSAGLTKRIISFQRNTGFLLLMSILFLTAVQLAANAQSIRYVKAGGNGSGSSWASASGDLQAMINASSSGGQVWVAAGTYKPTTGTDRSISFVMKEGVAIYGSFAGTESALTNRPAINFSSSSSSILSGEIGSARVDDNTYNVILNYQNNLTSAAVIDGFVITGGYANGGNYTNDQGGGINNTESNPTIRSCSFTDNTANSYGGAIMIISGGSEIINCNFINNTVLSEIGYGGAIECYSSSINLTNCSFRKNYAASGGAVHLFNTSNSNIINCTFVDNTWHYLSGAIFYQRASGQNNIVNSIVWGSSLSPLMRAVSSNVTVSYSDIDQDGYENTNGNFKQNPLFIDAANGDLRLKPNSPVINKGNNSSNNTSKDLGGNARVVGSTIDVGAYEFQCTPTVISSQPQNASACDGSSAKFTVGVTGPNLTYKWYKDGKSARSSSNSSTLTINNVTDADAGSYTADVISSCGTVTSGAATLAVTSASKPVVTVTNNCGFSTLSTTTSGSLVWNTGETGSSISVNNAGTYTVTQTINGCTSASGSATTEPKNIPPMPLVSVTNNCGSSTLSTNATGSLLWSTNETSSSINVSDAGSYTVTQTVNGCTSSVGSADAAPKDIPLAPVVTVANNCSSSTLSTNASGSLLWSTGETGSSITVSNAGTYTVTQTVDGCTSDVGSGTAAPSAIPSTPVVTVTNNCGSSTLSTTATGTLLWSTGETSFSINVSNAGTYTVTQTVNGCTSLAGSGTAAPEALPSKPAVTANGSTDFCQGGSVVLSAPSGFAGYKWSNNATGQTINATQSGSYSVVVTNAAGCSSPASDAITVTVGNDTQKPDITCPAAVTLCYAATENYTIASLQATDNCGIASISYNISGATTRSGNGANASGIFKPGTSTITWTVKDASGNTSTCQNNVTVNEKFTVSIPDGWALGSGCTLNTIYKGYVPAEYILLVAKPTGGKLPYTYKWSNGSTASFILVNPAAVTTYTVTAKDAKGCTQTASKQIDVVDVRCGSKMDKVTLCYKGNVLCTDQKDVANYLLNGAYLGICKGKSAASKPANEIVQKEVKEESDLTVKASPNPSTAFFKLTVNSSNVKDKVSISIVDEVGRPVETRIASAGQSIQIGDHYRAGMYFAQAVQGNKRVTIKLIKQAW